MIDLRLASGKDRAKFDCAKCPDTVQKGRKCGLPSFDVLARPMHVDDEGLGFKFCPGKATWYEEAQDLYGACRVALEAGILPRDGSFEDQDAAFVDAFPAFVDRWRERNYDRVWRDVKDFTRDVLKQVLGKK